MTSLPEPRQGGNHGLVLCRPDRGRTCDLRIWNPLLYQLSYWPVQGDGSMSLEPESRIELPTFSLPRKRSTTELPGPIAGGGERRIRTFEGFSRQIYSLIPLTAWVSPPGWSWQWDSNPQPADYKSAALPIELCQHKANAEYNFYFEFCQSFEGIERNFTSSFRLPGGWDRLRPSGREEELEPHDRC